MIDPNSPDDEKLADARRMFDDTCDTYREFYTRAKEDLEFESGEQWNTEDLAILREEMRPPLVFNLLQSIIDHNIGTLEDAKKAPRVVAISRNDRFLADILNDLLDRERYEINLSADEMEAAHWAAITGLGGVAIDANEDPERDDYILISVTPLPHNEFKFDPNATKPDLSDAEYMFRDKWMTQSEFKRTYPKFADKWDDLLAQPTSQNELGGPITPHSPTGLPPDYETPSDDWGVNRARDELRVVHMEYKVAVKVRRARNTDDNSMMELTDTEVDALKDDGDFSAKFSLDPVYRMTIQTRWFEFAGASTILFDEESPLPIHGYSVVPFPWRRDRRSKTFQGKIRSLKDPQREINKRFSQEIHLINSMAQPGTDVETGASPMADAEFERATKTPGAVRRFNQGGLERSRERPMPQFPDSVARVHESAIQLVRVISNTTMDTLLEPRGIPEAAATAQLRHRQSTLAMVPVIRNYQSFQKTIARRLLEIVVESFGDQQLEDMLSNSDQFRVDGGVVTEIVPDGQEPRVASLRDIRTLRYNVELVTTAESENSNQLVQMQFLDTAQEKGFPISPEVYLDMMPLPRDLKDQLKEFAARQAQVGLQMEQAKVSQLQQQIAQATQADRDKNIVDLARLKEERRHNFAAEITQAVSVGFEHQRGMAKVIEAATSEQLGMIQTVIEVVARQQEAKLGRVERGLSSGGTLNAQ